MICEICNKNPATIHIQEIVNGEKKVLHICAECAAKKSSDDPMLQGFNVAEMLYNLSGQFGLPFSPEPQKPSNHEVELECPVCHWTSEDLKKNGKLGCEECYNVFKGVIASALKTMHRGTLHVGKTPGETPENSTGQAMLEIMNLQKELDELVQREEYEKAAVIRDQINKLKEDMKK